MRQRLTSGRPNRCRVRVLALKCNSLLWNGVKHRKKGLHNSSTLEREREGVREGEREGRPTQHTKRRSLFAIFAFNTFSNRFSIELYITARSQCLQSIGVHYCITT